MASSSEDEMQQSRSPHHSDGDDNDAEPPYVEDPDENTLRILVSTDNHLGYCEADQVRGLDSFAALEEVLWLARHYQADMVLLAGDLFHDNKPSRGTLHKTMDLFRRYCMGDNPIQIQIISDQKQNFRRGIVNYEDMNYSVDLPVFSIHGNHDDPTRERGSSDLYCALDLLDIANLVNYFGKQEKIDQIQVSPILMKKGDTHVALYGLGSMRDERLHRMWRSQKLKFMRPENHKETKWFNLFALHQNRDTGRGTKNCIQETMIPDWMDLVCWGHEHECNITPQESLVGTFRITQPGSSVATSLSAGEAEPKHVGILDIRDQVFRVRPIPLTQVRSFSRGELNLAEQSSLDPDDIRVDKKVNEVLDESVKVLIHDAREKIKENLQNAEEKGNVLATMKDLPLKYTLQKPDEVLVRLNVDHSGFSVLNNQRFGAKFVGDVANPTDILLYSRKKASAKLSSTSKKAKRLDPIEPDQLQSMNVDDLIIGELENADRKLELFDEKRVSSALGAYVEKQEAQAISETLSTLLSKQQKMMIKHGSNRDTVMDEVPEKIKKRGRKSASLDESLEVEDGNVLLEESPLRRKKASRAAPKKTAAKKIGSRSRKVAIKLSEEEGEFEEISPLKRRKSRARRGTIAKYTEDSDDEIEEVDALPSKASASSPTVSRTKITQKRVANLTMSDSEDEDIEILDEPSPPKRRGRAALSSSNAKPSRSRNQSSKTSEGFSQSQLSFQPVQRQSRTTTRKVSTRKATGTKYADDDSDDEEEYTPSRSYELEEGWGTTKTDTFAS